MKGKEAKTIDSGTGLKMVVEGDRSDENILQIKR